MRVREFKSNHKRNYLFGWDRTIRERIYVPHCWSPELQIIANGKLYLVYTALKTEKSNNYNIGNFLIPK
jgi:beta-xylosidase